MKILVVQESDWLNRNVHQQHQMLERLSTQGHQIIVLDYPIRWREEGKGLVAPRRVHCSVTKVVPNANISVIRTASLRAPGLGKLTWLATNTGEISRTLRTFRPDVVVNLGLSNGLVALRLAKRAGIPVVVHLIDALHTLAEPEVLRPVAAYVEHTLLRGADRVVVINKALGAYAVQMGAQAACVTQVPTGVDLERYGPHIGGAAIRDEYTIGPQETVLLFVGWLYSFSGLRELAQAMIAQSHTASSVRLLIVGDGDLMPDLIRLRDQHLGDRLILAGQQPPARIPEFLAAANICLLPAQVNQTMAHIVPAKVYEYLAAGKPILASRLPGLQAEFGEDSGITYIEDAHQLLTAADHLRMDPELRTEQGNAARRRAESNGTWDSVTSQFYAVLQETIALGSSVRT